MNWYKIIWHYQNRFKFWNWSEIFALTGQTPSEIIALTNKINLVDPLSVLPYSKKNYNSVASDYILENYLDTSVFLPCYNEFGISSRFVTVRHTPIWADYIYDTDWYWKQNWIRSFGQILLLFPTIKKVYIGCSTALQMSHNSSDLDLIIETEIHCVWATKVYFAILSKLVKYYDFNFFVWVLLKIKNDRASIKILKKQSLNHKIKIDFGLVYSRKKNEKESQTESWQKFYRDKERNLFIWRRLEIVQDFTNQFLNTPKDTPITGVIVVNKIFNVFNFWLLRSLFLTFLPIFFVIGLIAYFYQQHINKYNLNMLVRWNIYSQYNLIY